MVGHNKPPKEVHEPLLAIILDVLKEICIVTEVNSQGKHLESETKNAMALWVSIEYSQSINI